MNKRLQTYEQKGFLSKKEKGLYLCNTKNPLNSSFLILHSNAHGNMLKMPHLSSLQWNCKDELISASNGTFTSHYNYDAQGNRTRKTVVKDNIIETRYYINGYEVYRKKTNGDITLERKTLNIADDEKVFVRIEQKTGKNEITRYQYDNHLGSACLELDFEGSIISYEEYHPFGTTSYRSGKGETEVSLKRYKYNGKERDEETGLYAYGMRYYAAWLCRFVSVDPLQFKYPYYTPYQYAGNKPITFIDLDGAEEATTDDKKIEPEIMFIDKFTGKYLGSQTKGVEGFSVRAIAAPHYKDLEENDFEDVDIGYTILSVKNASKEVFIDSENILKVINEIAEKKTRNINFNEQEIERALLFIFDTTDPSNPSISALEQDDSGNDGGHANYYIGSFAPTHSVAGKNINLIVLGGMHTHVPPSITTLTERNSNKAVIPGTEEAGVSEKDKTAAADKLRAPNYALAKFKTKTTPSGSIFKVDAIGTGAKSKIPITNIEDVRNNVLNLIRDVIKSNIPLQKK